MVKLQVLSLNIRGLRKRSKRHTLMHRLKQRKCDVIGLQETYVDQEACKVWKQEWGGELYASPGTTHSN